ncbi:MAG: SPOR domain-containing protein [Paludibacter sp.]|nr:SPOR domain-containing protein [Paludibacter sp.]
MVPFAYFCEVEKFCQHIEKLLAQHDYVVVPNLGGFVVQIQSARILSDHIAPPLSTIGFNPLMLHADGLLAIEIARSEQISYRMAMEYIEKQVESLKIKIQSKRKIQFGDLGAFYMNNTENILFTPSVKVEFLPQNFELTNLYISQKEKQIRSEKPKITITLPSTRVFKYASVAMLAIGLFCISPTINDMRRPDNADILTSAFYNSTPKTVVSNTVATTESNKEEAIQEEQNNFHVIVASLPNQSTADKFCDELTAKDFPAAHVLPPGKTYRVAIQSFSKRDKAIEFMENLRKTDKRFETAWVFCNK